MLSLAGSNKRSWPLSPFILGERLKRAILGSAEAKDLLKIVKERMDIVGPWACFQPPDGV